MKKIIFIILINCLCSFYAISQELAGGILFKSSAERINLRTSLTLFEKNPQVFENSFDISFDLSIWDIKQFGYVLRIINDKNQEINFVYVNFKGEDELYLDFHSPITHKSVPIPIKKQDLIEKKWLHLKIEFNLQSDIARIFSNDTVYICKPIGLGNPSRLKFAFGLYGLNLDVPQMAIRNIRINEQQKPRYLFPLYQSEGNDIHDNQGKTYGHVKNPDWIINHHFGWQKKTVLPSSNSTGIAYDNINNRIFIINKDSISTYYPHYNQRKDTHIKGISFTVNSGEAIYHPQLDKCYLYNLGSDDTTLSSLAIIDMKDYSVIQSSPLLQNALHHHNVFWNYEQKNPCIFGGYGRYTYSAALFEYNPNTNNWDSLQLSGDKITPRYLAATGRGKSPSEILIMGGFGNESGQQEHGGRNLYDLFSLNLQSLNVKKLWEITDSTVTFVPCSNLILNREATHFYTLCYSHHQANTALHLYKFSLSDGSYETVSDSIPFIAEDMNTSAYLFFNEPTQEFYAITRESKDKNSSTISIYSLLYPPVTLAQLKSASANSQSRPIRLSILTGIISLVIVLFLFERKIRRRKKPYLLDSILPEKDKLLLESREKTAVYILGKFLIRDKKGADITYRFSQKLKSLFALMLLNSRNDSGVTTETLTALLWPGKDSQNAKNTRGVTINRLRSILADMEGIQLIYERSRWYFSLGDSFLCDYIESYRIIQSLNNKVPKSEEEMEQLINIVKRGPLFPNIQEDWIDKFKREYEDLIESTLKKYIIQLYEDKKYTRLIYFAEAYLSIDPLDEDILELSLKSFHKKGKAEQAQLFYNKFAANYKKSMGEEYKRKFTYFVKK